MAAAPETEDDQLIDTLTEKMRAGLQLSDRKWMLKTYPNCFVGSECVDWLVSNGEASSREEAITVGQMLLASHVIKHVTNDHDFRDGKFYYRFVADEPSHGTVEQADDGSKMTWAHKLIPQVARRESGLVMPTSALDLGNEPNEFAKTASKLTPLDEPNQELLNNVHPPQWQNPEPSGRYNIVAIGAGAAGLVSAAGTAGLGGKAAIIEQNLFGGDCLNYGCVPSKCLLKSAKVIHDAIHRGAEYGLEINDFNINFEKVMRRMRDVRAKISHHDACERFTTQYGLDVFIGRAKFIDRDKIQVNDDTVLQFSRAVIATGGTPTAPPIPGLADVEYLTNHDIFNLTDLPPRFGVLGAGPIGCEMAFAFSQFGSEVTIIEYADHILPREDPEAAQIIEDKLKECGIRLLCAARTKTIGYADSEGEEKVDGGDDESAKPRRPIMIDTVVNGEEMQFVVDELLVATGRRPNVDNLGLEEAGVFYSARTGVEVNDFLQTTNPNIYAAGDCTSRFQFTHMADAMARIVIRNALFFGRGRYSQLLVPWCTYTHPEVAHVGSYERDLDGAGIEYDVFKIDLAENDRALTEGENQGFVKVMAKKGTDKILGATIVAAHAGEMISEISVAMAGDVGLAQIASVIHPYPTVSEGIKAAGDAFNRTKLSPLNRILLRKILAGRR